MNKSRRIFALFVLIGINTLNAQVKASKIGDNPTILNRSAALEVESSTKGILIPRLALTGATDGGTITGGNVPSLLVYNTATAGGLTPGYHYWSGAAWVRIISSEVLASLERDGIVGNEVVNATPNRGLIRSGTGTEIDPYTLGLPVGGASGHLISWNGTNWVSSAPAPEADGVIGNEITNIIPGRGGMVRTGAGTAASPFMVGLVDGGSVVGQILKWDGIGWTLGQDNNNNIYNTDGTLTTNRIVNMGTNDLIFQGAVGDKIELRGPMTLTHQDEFVINANSDNSGENQDLILQVGGADYLHIANMLGYVGLATSGPSERLDVNGNVRIRAIVDGSDKGRFNQQVVIDGMGILGKTALVTDLDTFVGNEVTNTTPNRGLSRSGMGTAALPYTVGLMDGTASGQVLQWNGTAWALAVSTNSNLYTANGTLTDNRIITQTAAASNLSIVRNVAGTAGEATNGYATLRIGATATDGTGFNTGGRILLTGYSGDTNATIAGYEEAAPNAGRALSLKAGAAAGTNGLYLRDNGNVGIGTNIPAAKLDVVGNVRVGTLPAGTATDDIVTANATTGVLQKRSITDIITTAAKKVRTLATSFTLAPDDDIIVYNGPNGLTMTIPTTGVPIGKTWYIANIGDTATLNFDRNPLNTGVVSVPAAGSVTIAIVSNTGDFVVLSGY